MLKLFLYPNPLFVKTTREETRSSPVANNCIMNYIQLHSVCSRIERSALTSARLNGLEVDLHMTGEPHLFSNVIHKEYIYWQHHSILSWWQSYMQDTPPAQTPSNMVILKSFFARLATRLDPTCIPPCWSGHLQNYDDPVSQALIPPSPPANMDELDQSEQSHAMGLYHCRLVHFHHVKNTETYNKLHHLCPCSSTTTHALKTTR